MSAVHTFDEAEFVLGTATTEAGSWLLWAWPASTLEMGPGFKPCGKLVRKQRALSMVNKKNLRIY